MEKLLLDTFDGLSLTDRQKKLFSDVYVNRVVLSKRKKTITIYMESKYIIAFREIGLLSYALNQQMGKTGFSVLVCEHFSLSEQYTPKAFWEEYKDSILLILKETNVLLFNMIYKGNVKIEGISFHLACENDALFQTREQQFIEMVQSIFREKAGLLVEVSVDFSLPVQLGESREQEVYHRNVKSVDFSKNTERSVLPKKKTSKETVTSSAQKAAEQAASFSDSAPVQKVTEAPFSGKGQNHFERKSYSKGKSKWGAGPVDEECFYGRNCEGEVVKIADIQ